MSRRAWLYIVCVWLTGIAVSTYALLSFSLSQADLLTFGCLVILATLAQLYAARAPGHQSYHFTPVLIFAGVLVLSPLLVVLLVAIPHLVEWGKERWAKSARLRNWYLQPFNIATHILAAALAQWAFVAVAGNVTLIVSPRPLIAAVGASVIYLLLNHTLVGIAVLTARRVSLHDSGILNVENLLTDWILLLMGVTVAVLWAVHPLLILPALAPILLIYQALKVPQLKMEASTDSKTGLWNARHFGQLFGAEMQRAQRFSRPLALIMADLDLLRNVNNTYGHLAGDAVLAGVGKIIHSSLREYDTAGRFGGEEFTIALPETELEEARKIAERIRATVENTEFPAAPSSTPIHVTMSFGVACYPQDGVTPTDLIHQADIAVYQAKLQGRNRVACARDIPHSAKLEFMPQDDRLTAPSIPEFTPRPEIPLPGGEPPKPERVKPSPAAPKRNPVYFAALVALVIAAGSLVTMVGLARGPLPEIVTIGVLLGLALVAQLPQVKNLYGESSVSVSMAINFAAALLAGIPAVAAVSALIALVHYLQRRPLAYRTGYNWATHVLAGSAPVLVVGRIPNSFQPLEFLWLTGLVTAAGLAFYLIETGLIAAGISSAEGIRLIPGWRKRYQWLAPHYVVLSLLGLFIAVAYMSLDLPGIVVVLTSAFMLSYAQKQYTDHTAQSIGELRRMNQELEIANRHILDANKTIHQMNDELFLTLSKIIDARDPYVLGHAIQVAKYATSVAKEIGLPPERITQIHQAGLLHDIGKIGISEEILHKPAKLTGLEYEKVKAHTTIGSDFLQTSALLRQLAPFIRGHHEYWNGKGYPDGLAGEEIPLEARILAVCDAVESMASDRPYHRALGLDEIIAEIHRCAGKQFDPHIAGVCVRILRREGSGLVVNSARGVARQNGERGVIRYNALFAPV
ncbi:MAG: diguanylate cyclase [Chloroflexi bacterium]|nr:diguanylate cyclase [Chloroflexota bacterium]